MLSDRPRGLVASTPQRGFEKVEQIRDAGDRGTFAGGLKEITVARYARLLDLTNVYVMPVLQGYSPRSYAAHVDCYDELLTPGQWVGVGSVCKRNGNPDQIEDILLAIKTRCPDLRPRGFGIKFHALQSPTVRELLYSSDSMA
jgi:hypothetical protein